MGTINPHVAIVVARYGPSALGGAESLARGFAEEAAARGWLVEVLTTCALDPYEWTNVINPGEEEINGVVIKRFPVTVADASKRRELGDKLRIQQTIQIQEQYEWLTLGPQSSALYNHLLSRGNEYDLVISLPYLDSIAYHAAWLLPQKTLFWPCLHDEVFAYLEPFRLLSENVLGVIFNSPEEADLALFALKWRLDHHATLGLGVNLISNQLGVDRAANRSLLYVGRLEHAKNLWILYDYAKRFWKDNPDFQLDIIGRGPFSPPDDPVFQETGFVSEEEKAVYYRHALALCQPSLNESLSLVVMESWLAGRPVLVSLGCPVTIGHVRRSKGGLGFETYNEFAGSLMWFRDNPEAAAKMGQNGRAYVLSNYTWKAVFDKLSQYLDRWQPRGWIAERPR